MNLSPSPSLSFETRRFERPVGGTTVTVLADAGHGAAVSGLFAVLERMPREHLADGRHVAYHFNLFVLRASGDGLTVLVPDYLGDPFTDLTEDLSVAMWVVHAQSALLRRFDVDAQPARWDDKVVLRRGVLDEEKVYLHRTATSTEHDSGWYVGPLVASETAGAPGVDDLSALRAYELLTRRRALVPVLALPDEHVAIVVGDDVVEVQGPDEKMLPDRSAPA